MCLIGAVLNFLKERFCIATSVLSSSGAIGPRSLVGRPISTPVAPHSNFGFGMRALTDFYCFAPGDTFV